MRELSPDRSPPGPRAAGPSAGSHRPSPTPRGGRALVVEDEVIIMMLLEDMLGDLGYEVAATATGLHEAVELARQVEVDFAILDVNLAGQMSFPIAEALAQRGIPFLFATGYGIEGVAPAYAAAPVLQKPYGPQALDAAIARILSREH